MSAGELAAVWRIPVATVRRWIYEDMGAEHEWPRTVTMPYRYDPDAAQAALDRRRAGREETLVNLEIHRRRVGRDQ